jgi:enoyl-CoA hydratase
MSSTPTDAPAHVTCTVADAVATIAIDDGKANALSHAVLAGIETALDQALDAGADAVVVSGRDGKFSAGFDLSVMTAGPTQARDLLGRGAELGLRLYEFPVPVVFAVTGHALAMGGILQCCADVRIGAAGPYKIGLPEVRIGMPVPAFAVELCRDRLSPRWFTRSVLLGEGLDPQQALDAGFLDEVVELDQVRGRAQEIAADLAANVHRGPFRLTRPTARGALAEQLRAALAEDLSAFSVESP